MIDTPESDNNTDQPDSHLPDSNAIPLSSDSAKPNDEKSKPKQRRHYAQYVMRPLKAIGRAFIATVTWLDKYDGAVTAIATIVIACLTAAYVHYAKAQWKVMGDQLGEMIRQYPELQTSAEAAKSSADIQRETMIRAQRPWLGHENIVKLTLKVFPKQEVVGGNLIFTVKNFGPSPALIAGAGAQPFIRTVADESDFINARKAACGAADTTAFLIGDTVFPQQIKQFDAIAMGEIKNISKSPMILVAGCLSYRDQFDTTKATHHTSFCVMGKRDHLEVLGNCGMQEVAD